MQSMTDDTSEDSTDDMTLSDACTIGDTDDDSYNQDYLEETSDEKREKDPQTHDRGDVFCCQ